MTLKLNAEFNATFNAKIIYVHLAPGTVILSTTPISTFIR